MTLIHKIKYSHLTIKYCICFLCSYETAPCITLFYFKIKSNDFLSLCPERGADILEEETVKRGFTMLEILLAIMILAIMTIISTMVFHTIVRNWTLATEMADNMQRVDYVTEQVVYGLRSAYFPTSGDTSNADGFMLLDNNENNDRLGQLPYYFTAKAQSRLPENCRGMLFLTE